MIWFTSDTHFDHANVVTYCNRPFGDVEEMNRVLVERWNERVAQYDIVYHLGDFHLGRRERIADIRRQLNGTILLVRGNHDRSPSAMRQAGFAEVMKSQFLKLDGVSLYLRHDPYGEIEKPVDYRLCGHVHGEWSKQGNILNVGVDVRDFCPVTLEELLKA